MYKVYLLEIKSIHLNEYTNAYINDLNAPAEEKLTDSRQEFFIEKKKLIAKIKKNLK